MDEEVKEARAYASRGLRQAEQELNKKAALTELTTRIARQEGWKIFSLMGTLFLAYVAKDWGIGGWGPAIALVTGFILTYRIASEEWDMPGFKLYDVRLSADEYAILRLLEKHWMSGTLKWKVHTDEDDLGTENSKKTSQYIAPEEFNDSDLSLLEADSILEFIRISSNARKKKIKDLRKELEPVFREARSYANETGVELSLSLKSVDAG